MGKRVTGRGLSGKPTRRLKSSRSQHEGIERLGRKARECKAALRLLRAKVAREKISVNFVALERMPLGEVEKRAEEIRKLILSGAAETPSLKIEREILGHFVMLGRLSKQRTL